MPLQFIFLDLEEFKLQGPWPGLFFFLFLINQVGVETYFCMVQHFPIPFSIVSIWLTVSTADLLFMSHCLRKNYYMKKVRGLSWQWNQALMTTLLCGIIMLHILFIFDFFPCRHALLGTAHLLILLKNSYRHVYLQIRINCFRGNLSISLDIWLPLDL